MTLPRGGAASLLRPRSGSRDTVTSDLEPVLLEYELEELRGWSDLHRATLLLEGQNDILREIAAGSPLSSILSRLVSLVEQVEPDLTASIIRINQSIGSLLVVVDELHKWIRRPHGLE